MKLAIATPLAPKKSLNHSLTLISDGDDRSSSFRFHLTAIEDVLRCHDLHCFSWPPTPKPPVILTVHMLALEELNEIKQSHKLTFNSGHR